MNSFSQFLQKIFNDVILILLLITCLLIQIWMIFGNSGIIQIHEVSNGYLVPNLYPFQGIQNLKVLMEAYGANGRAMYLRLQFLNFVFPILYGLLMMGLLVRLIKPKSFNLWIYVPIFAVLFSLIANYFLRTMFYDYPKIIESKLNLIHIAFTLNFLFILFSLVLIVIAFKNRRKKFKREQSRLTT